VKVIRRVNALWQAASGTVNPPFYQGQALAVRIVPSTLQGALGASAANLTYLPRTLLIDDTRQNNIVELADSSWYVIDRQALQNAYFGMLAGKMQGDDTSLSPHIVGPRVVMRFNVEQVGASNSDQWDIYIAEDPIDCLTPIVAPLTVPLVKDNATGLLTQGATAFNGFQQIIVISQGDGQVLDTTPAGGAAATTGTIGAVSGATYREVAVKLVGLTAPSTRTVKLTMVRNDTTTTDVFITPAFGATITDALVIFGGASAAGAAAPVNPLIVTTSSGLYFPNPIPPNFQINVTAGGATDNPRITVYCRNQT
jgi:hypothetical protein